MTTHSHKHTCTSKDAANVSCCGHPPAQQHSAVHAGWQASKVGSLLKLATAALLQELNTLWQVSAQAIHVVLLINFGSHALQPGDELLWAPNLHLTSHEQSGGNNSVLPNTF